MRQRKTQLLVSGGGDGGGGGGSDNGNSNGSYPSVANDDSGLTDSRTKPLGEVGLCILHR